MKDQIGAVIEFLRDRKRAYQLTFELMQPANQIVLGDLARFCCACRTTKTEREAGRREAWLRIQNHLHLTEEQLFALYSGNPAVPTEKAS